MSVKILTKFVKEARKRGFSDLDIRKEVKLKGYSLLDLEKVFIKLQPKVYYKNQICLFLNKEVIDILQKRAKKNKFNLSEQIEDILRRSSIRKSTKKSSDKIDDLLLKCFSRSTRGRKKR
jgi:hypothetical protein